MSVEIEGRKVFVSEETSEVRYKLWRKYIPVLYEFVATQPSEWPASCVEMVNPSNGHWGKALESASRVEASTRLIITGTYTGDSKKDSINVVRVEIPAPYSYATAKGNTDVDDDGFETDERLDRLRVRSTPLFSVPHNDEVLSARCMPQRSCIVASKSSSALYLYDFRSGNPEASCMELAQIAGVVVTWSPLKLGQLAVGSDDGNVIVMDVSLGVGARRSMVRSQDAASVHKSTVMGIEWHPNDINRFLSCSQDGSISSWDVRDKKCICTVTNAHGEAFGVNCVSFNPRPQSNYFVSGVGWKENSANGEMHVPELPTVKMWDDRKLGKGCVHDFVPPTSCILHDDLGTQVYQTRWNPHNPDQFAACSGDGTVRVWDVSKIGTTFENEVDSQDGPPELAFVHAGHTDPVSDVQYDETYPNTFVSVADDNICMFWRPLVRI